MRSHHVNCSPGLSGGTSSLQKQAIRVVYLSEAQDGWHSWYFLVPKRNRGLCPILDMHPLNKDACKDACIPQIQDAHKSAADIVRASRQLVHHHRPKGCVISCAHVPQSQKVPEITFFWSSRSALSLSPCIFSKVVEAALVPMRGQGLMLLAYLDYWLKAAVKGTSGFTHIQAVVPFSVCRFLL